MRPSLPSGPAVAAVLLAVALLATPVVGAEVRITSVSFGDDTAPVREETRYVWRTATVDAVVTVDGATGDPYEACLRSRPPNGSARRLDCQRVRPGDDGRATVTLDPGGWAGPVGPRTVAMVVRPADGGSPVARTTLAVHVMERDGDVDGDGIDNARERDGDVDFLDPDTDDDGLVDGLELDVHDTSPTAPDTDGDGLTDGPEVTVYRTDPTAPDTDGDGLSDTAEVEDHGTDPNRADTDGDGLADPLEVDAYGTDPTAVDTDVDGLSDGRETTVHRTVPTAPDTDGDGLEDGTEVDRHDTDPNRADTDGDGLSDGAEVNRYGTDPAAADTDGDGTGDAAEVRPALPVHPWLPAALVGLAALVGAAFAARRRGLVPAPETVVPVPALLGRGDGTSGGGDPTDGDGAAPTDPVPPAADGTGYRSDEARVLALLRGRGGRVRQSEVVEATDWSKAKVSRLLSSMAEDGQVRKVNIGRGNVIELPADDADGDEDGEGNGRE